MDPAGTGARPRWLQAVRRYPRTPFIAVLAGLLALLVVDLLIQPVIRLGPLMVAAPALVAILGTLAEVVITIAVTYGFITVAASGNLQLGSANFYSQLITATLISAGAVWAALVRRKRERKLAQTRWVAEVTQRLLLRPLPSRLGSLVISGMYLAADEEAAIGGDLYAAAETDGTARILIGDAQGKGLSAVETAGCVLDAFRSATDQRLPLPQLPAYLDRRLCKVADRAGRIGQDSGTRAGLPAVDPETFVTAAVVEMDENDSTMRIVNCGHPPPLRLTHDGEVEPVTPPQPALPLGLGALSPGTPPVCGALLRPGETLVLYTDGVSEARDQAGDFYPLGERLTDWAGYGPGDLLAALGEDLRRHVRGQLKDDVAVIAIRHAP